MPDYRLLSEEEGTDCWFYEVELPSGSSMSSRHRIRLSWADYDLWVRDGSIEPVRVAEAVLKFVRDHPAFDPLPQRIDSAHPRRHDSRADEAIGRIIRAPEHETRG